MVRFLITWICIFLAVGCVPPIVHNKAKFVLKENLENNGNKGLKTTGYYYSIYSRKPNEGKKGVGIKMKIPLNNGYVYNFKNGYGNQCGDSVSLACEFEMSERLLRNYLEWQKAKEYTGTVALWDWGRYNIDNKKILLQSFYNQFGDYYLLEEHGEVLDSVSFKILQKKDYRTGAIEKVEEIYVFKPYDVSWIYKKIPKHNVFIK
jgi:hypothetical protein